MTEKDAYWLGLRRINRSRYIAYHFMLVAGFMVWMNFFMFFGGRQLINNGAFAGFSGLLFLGLHLNFQIRRLHDMDKTLVWLVLNCIPIIMEPILIFVPGTDGPNRYGPALQLKTPWVKIGGIFVVILTIHVLLVNFYEF
jgi:uncharacterized membrane protein YhaH (DUF805 family)